MEEGEGIIIVPVWPTQPWYPKLMSLLVDMPRLLPVTRGTLYLPSKPSQPHPMEGKLKLIACKLSGNPLRSKAFLQKLPRLSSSRGGRWKGTSKQYQSYYKKWLDFCHREQISTVHPSLAQVIEFLLTLFNNGLSYSSLNTARSALSSILPSIDGIPVGQHPLVIRFLKGVFESRPAMPRYTAVWDVNQALDYLKTLYPVNEISLKSLTLKLTMLLALVTAQRGQSLLFLNVASMIDSGSSIVFSLQEHVKQSKPGSKGMVIELKSFTDPRLCVVTTLKEYLSRTKFARETRSCSQLLRSYVKPYGPVSRDTISHWVKFVLQSSGIDVNIFKPHSTRSASTSKAKMSDVPLADILDKAGWKSESTFAKFYDKKIVEDTFASKVLQ